MVVDGNVGVTDDDMKVAKPFVWKGRSFVEVSEYSYPYMTRMTKTGGPSMGNVQLMSEDKASDRRCEACFSGEIGFSMISTR